MKAHVLISHDDYMPVFVHISDAKMADVETARLLDLRAGSVVAMDRGYNDYDLFSRWSERRVYFVTTSSSCSRSSCNASSSAAGVT